MQRRQALNRTLNPKPETRNLKPYIPNPIPNPESLNRMPFFFCLFFLSVFLFCLFFFFCLVGFRLYRFLGIYPASFLSLFVSVFLLFCLSQPPSTVEKKCDVVL
jgi:hypothetical protein